MIIQDVVDLAKYSELSGVSVKNDINTIVAFINLGMTELYTRFPVKTEEYAVPLVAGVYYYTMPANFMYATSAHGEVPADPAKYTPSVSINDDSDHYSVFFHDWRTLKVPRVVEGGSIFINYNIKPERVTVQQAIDGVTELELPDSLVDALLSYIGYRAYLGIKTDSQAANTTHLARFERNCDKALELGAAFPVESMSMFTRISDRGFA